MRTPQELDQLAEDLYLAWKRYRAHFEEDPHGTLKQLRALLELLPNKVK